MSADHAYLIARLRGGSHHAEPMILGGVPHDGRCLRAAEVIRQLLEERDAARAALRFYANPETYQPHPHGPAFDSRDLSGPARRALGALAQEQEPLGDDFDAAIHADLSSLYE